MVERGCREGGGGLFGEGFAGSTSPVHNSLEWLAAAMILGGTREKVGICQPGFTSIRPG